MMPSLSEVVTRPEKSRPDHGEPTHETSAQHRAEVQHVRRTSRPKAGVPSELEKRKSTETPVSPPARIPTPVILKNKIKQPRSKSYTEHNITIVTQNIRGTQGSRDHNGNTTDLGDIEAIVDIMHEKNIDIYLLQETWIYRDMEVNIRGITFINHGVEKGNNKGGVAILLNKRAEKGWNAAGRPDPYKSGTLAGDNTRILMIELLFQPRKRQSTRLLIASVYAPQSGITAKNPEFIQQFYKAMGSIATNAKKVPNHGRRLECIHRHQGNSRTRQCESTWSTWYRSHQ
jgi:hypothetical protein